MTDQNKMEEIRALLSEAYGFKSTSKGAQENINAALDLLDSIATPAIPAVDAITRYSEHELRHVFEREASKGLPLAITGVDFRRDDDGDYQWAATRRLYEFWKTSRALATPSTAPVTEDDPRVLDIAMLMVRYHQEVWDAAQGEENDYDLAGRDTAKKIIKAICAIATPAHPADAGAVAVEQAKPDAWMRSNLKECTTAASKAQMENAGFGVWAEVAKEYNIPLYFASQPQATPLEATSEQPEPNTERDLFESAQRKHHWPLAEADLRQDKIGNYYNHVTQANWSMWQARAAIAAHGEQMGGAQVASSWKPLMDSHWVNIVNHEHAYENYTKDDAVHEAVKRTEAKLRELNAPATGAQVAVHMVRARGSRAWYDGTRKRLEKARSHPDLYEVATLFTSPTERAAAPIPMVLHCPKCHVQHIDAPDERTANWENPPHRSHLCHACGNIWRPADVATEGVRTIQTRGSKDSESATAPASQHEIDFLFLRIAVDSMQQDIGTYLRTGDRSWLVLTRELGISTLASLTAKDGVSVKLESLAKSRAAEGEVTERKPIGPYKLTRSIIHECPALVLPQGFMEKLGNMAQLVVLKGATNEVAEALLAKLNATERKPLTETELRDILHKYSTFLGDGEYSETAFDCAEDLINFVRAIEQHHGIGGGK